MPAHGWPHLPSAVSVKGRGVPEAGRCLVSADAEAGTPGTSNPVSPRMLPSSTPCPRPHLFYLMSATVSGPELNCVTTKQQVSCLALWVSKTGNGSWPLINLVGGGGHQPPPPSQTGRQSDCRNCSADHSVVVPI